MLNTIVNTIVNCISVLSQSAAPSVSNGSSCSRWCSAMSRVVGKWGSLWFNGGRCYTGPHVRCPYCVSEQLWQAANMPRRTCIPMHWAIYQFKVLPTVQFRKYNFKCWKTSNTTWTFKIMCQQILSSIIMNEIVYSSIDQLMVHLWSAVIDCNLSSFHRNRTDWYGSALYEFRTWQETPSPTC